MKLTWEQRAKNNELKDVVGFMTDIFTANHINSADRNFQEITAGLRTIFVHYVDSDPDLVSL